MHLLPSFGPFGCGKGGGLSFGPNFQKGRLGSISILRVGLLGKRGVTFSGCYSFYIKNELKSEIWNNNKKPIDNNFFLCHNLYKNWEILSKNLVTFKRWDGFKDEKRDHYEKLDFYRGGVMKNQHIGVGIA